MSDQQGYIDPGLAERTKALLEPGDIELVGAIVHTDLGTDQEAELHDATIDIGNRIAEYGGVDPMDTYVYSGNDDPEFGLNQHQGRTLEDDEFVYECQQLRRDEQFKVVFYYDATVDQAALLSDLRSAGYTVEGVAGD
jgi:hypothetical protein